MTDQIAPSLATELEQAAKECRAEIAQCEADYQEAVKEGQRTGSVVHERVPCEDCAKYLRDAALLTRAAALARAAEKVTNFDPVQADFDNQVNYCPFCGVIFGMDAPFKHLGGCVWAELRALVSSEGKGEA